MSFSSQIMAGGLSAESAKAIVGSITKTAIAAGTNQATALRLGTVVNFITTVAAGTGVMLPTMNDADLCVIFNQGANALLVYPPVGFSIDSQSVNASISVPVSTSVFIYGSGNNNYTSKNDLATLGLSTSSGLVGFSHANTYAQGTVGLALQVVINVKNAPYNAVGDGVTDDTAAIQAAHDALPSIGGGLFLPNGAYLISSTLLFTKRVFFSGTGTLEDHTATAPCRLIKAATATGNLITLSGFSSRMQGIACVGVAGNTGDGIQIKGNNITLRDVSVVLMGSNGIRIGHSDSTNCNDWVLDNVVARANGGEGVYIHSDDTGVSINANAGTAINLSANTNTGKGLRIKNGQKNTLVGLHTETNTAEGIYLEGKAVKNVFIGGDQESNGTADINVTAATCTDNHFISVGYNGTFTDSGTRTMRTDTGLVGLPQTLGEIASSGPVGASFSGSNEHYIQLYGDSNGRIRFGWKVDGPATGLVPAQVLADALVLYLSSRDNANAKVRLQGGSGLAGYLLLDHANTVVETNESLAALKATAIPAGGTAGSGLKVSSTANFGIFFGSSAPTLSAAKGSLYLRSDGTGTTDRMYVNTNGSTTWTAVTTVA